MQGIESLYIHFPFCMHLCNYCDFYKNRLENIEQVENFEKLFITQWNAHKNFLKENERTLSPLKTLYLGGGTPSLWKTRGAKFLKDFFKSEGVSFQKDFEFTMEVDPGTCDHNDLESWMSSGVNRFSIGLQAFDNSYLKLMDRKHTCADAKQLFLFMQKSGANFSIDLMIGLPSDKARNIRKEIEELLKFSPSHFSVYILKARKNYEHFKDLPSDDVTRREYLEVCEILKEYEYEQYEVSNFAKKGLRSIHNQNYWDYEEVAAVGPNSTGLISESDKATRYQWKSLSAGFQTEEIEASSLKIEKIFLSLRSRYGLSLEDIFTSDEDRIKINDLYQKWEMDGFITANSSGNKPELSSLGYLMNDSLIDDIFKAISF